MKKLLIFILLLGLPGYMFGQVWSQQRAKIQFNDSTKFKKDNVFEVGARFKGGTSGYHKVVAPAVAGTTTSTLPSASGTIATTQNINDSLNAQEVSIKLADSTGILEGNYMPRLQTADLINDSLNYRLAAALEGIELADSTGFLEGSYTTGHDHRKGVYDEVSTGNITAGTGITAAMLSRVIYYNGGSAIDISANPQIVNGSSGQIITIVGGSDTNTLTLDDSTGLRLSAQCVLGIGDTITLLYEGNVADWVEIGRSNN